MLTPDRRMLLAALSASLLPSCRQGRGAAKLPRAACASARPETSALTGCAALAQKNAGQPYQAAAKPGRPAIIQGIDFDDVQKIRFRADHALWRGMAGPDPVAFFHLNKYSADPVSHSCGEQAAMAREISIGPDYFDYGASGLDPKRTGQAGLCRLPGHGRARTSRSTGWPSRAPAISAPPARTSNMAPPPAASPSTPRFRRRRNFPASSQFWLEERDR